MLGPINAIARNNASLDICLGCMEPSDAGAVCSRCGWSSSNSQVSVLHLAPGTVLHGCYLVGRVLGQGGFGITYLGWDMALSRKIAIKEYFPQTLASRQTGNTSVVPHSTQSSQDFAHGLHGFLEEGRILARFSQHPCIVPVLSLFEANGTGYLVMGYIEGITLAQYLAKEGGKIPYDRTYEIMLRVMDGLREVHGQGLLHRDISPDNIYLSLSGGVKILDFGAARFAALDRSQSLSVVLKPGYAPEEQYRRNGKQGPWTDVYATAATFYRCITGTPPPESLERLVEDTLPSPRQFGAELPPKAEEALVRALAVRAERRFETMEAFQKSLAGETVPQTHKVSWAPPEPILLTQTKTELQGKSQTRSRFGANRWSIGLAAAALLIGIATLFGMKYLKSRPTPSMVRSANILPPSQAASNNQPPPATPPPTPKPDQSSETDAARKQLEQIEAEKKKAQADAAEAAKRQQQAEAAAAKARADAEAAEQQRKLQAAQAAEEERVARVRQEQEQQKQREEEERQLRDRQRAAEEQRLREESQQHQAEARQNPDWIFSVDQKTYKIHMDNEHITISPSTGTLSAQLQIKSNKKGQQQITGQWQSGALSGFVLIQAVTDQAISGYILIPQTQGANCTTRTAAFLGNLGNGMNHQVEGCRQVNVTWHRR